jgi:undecaprenyl-diphosphatase
MDWLQIVVLSLVQGLTEFLPVSSSAHLILPAQLTDWPDQGLAFDVGVHFGTLIAVIAYFRIELTKMAGAVISYPIRREYDADIDLVLKLGLATVPIVIIGFTAKDFVETNLRTIPVIASSTIIFALALWFADRKPRTDTPREGMMSWLQVLFIGATQVLALVPGTSRSGITITAALLVGLSRSSAARFSFLLAIPTISGAQLLLTLDLIDAPGQQQWVDMLSGAVIAGSAAYLCIQYFIALVDRTGMMPYVIYRLLLGAALFGIYYL